MLPCFGFLYSTEKIGKLISYPKGSLHIAEHVLDEIVVQRIMGVSGLKSKIIAFRVINLYCQRTIDQVKHLEFWVEGCLTRGKRMSTIT